MKRLCWGLLLTLVGCAHAPSLRQAQSVRMEAEGWAPVAASDPIGTAKRALAEAQRQAVEKVTGVSLRARTRVEQAVSVEQKISAEVAGRILSYDVLSEREEGGFHRTRIRALVLKEPPRPEQARPELLPGNPRVLVRVVGVDDRKAVERSIAQTLREAGAMLGGEKADYVISGEATVSPLDSSGLEGFVSCRASLSLELRDPAKGELIASRSFEASGMDVSRRSAQIKALEQAGSLAGRRLAADLRARLEE